MQPLVAVELALLREPLPGGSELNLAPGRVLAARVVTPQLPNAAGKLAMAGMTMAATLPEHLKEGDQVQVVVRSATPERLTLGLVPPPVPQTQAAVLPGGSRVRVTDRQVSGGLGEEIRVHSLTLRYETPNLGAVDLHFQLSPTGLQLSVRGSTGDGLELMRSNLGELRTALQAASPGAAVGIASRRDLVRYA